MKKKWSTRKKWAVGLIVFGALGVFGGAWVALIFVAIGGLLLYTDRSKASPAKRELTVETFHAAGSYYYEDNIKKLSMRNDMWKSTTKSLLASGKAGSRVYRYNFINKPVKLIPEPTNEHDKNAVMIQIAGEKVGYIPATDAVHVKDILSKREIKYISAFIGGGEYKVPFEDGHFEKFEESISVNVRIGYVK